MFGQRKQERAPHLAYFRYHARLLWSDQALCARELQTPSSTSEEGERGTVVRRCQRVSHISGKGKFHYLVIFAPPQSTADRI